MVVFNYLVPALVMNVCTMSPSYGTSSTSQLMQPHRHDQLTVQNVVRSA